MPISEKQMKEIETNFIENIKKAQFEGLKEGSKAMLGVILKMCNEGKTVKDIKRFCEYSLNLEGMK